MRPPAFALLLAGTMLAGSDAQVPPAMIRRTGTFQDRHVDESSGVVVSRQHPGLLWTMNDSGGDPVLFATDTLGTPRGVFPVGGAQNQDWEALSRGACGRIQCIVIGDTGDNAERRPEVTLYRIPEPDPAHPGPATKAERVMVRYPDRPHDVEALYVESDGAVILITKGRRGGVLVFRVPASDWSAKGTVVPERIDSLPIPASMSTGRVVTDAALSPDGKLVAVRTYREIWFFRRAADGRLTLDPGRGVCNIAGHEPQGEGVDWMDGETLVLTSERGLSLAGTITLVRCPAS